MAKPPLDLGPETPDCPGRFHGTYHAVRSGGCSCPSARAVYLERKRAWGRAEREQSHRQRQSGTPRWRDVDPIAVERAVGGTLTARALTTDERRQVVARLTSQGKIDREIAELLRWSGGGYRGMKAVAKFRDRWEIPAAVPARRRDLIGVAA